MCLYLLLYNFYYCSCNLNNIRNTGLELKHRGYSKKNEDIITHTRKKYQNSLRLALPENVQYFERHVLIDIINVIEGENAGIIFYIFINYKLLYFF